MELSKLKNIEGQPKYWGRRAGNNCWNQRRFSTIRGTYPDSPKSLPLWLNSTGNMIDDRFKWNRYQSPLVKPNSWKSEKPPVYDYGRIQ